MYKFCGNRGKFINFVKMGEYAICVIGLGAWTRGSIITRNRSTMLTFSRQRTTHKALHDYHQIQRSSPETNNLKWCDIRNVNLFSRDTCSSMANPTPNKSEFLHPLFIVCWQ